MCSTKELNDFVLVGCTALSLQIGHRKSIDIDLFTKKPYEVEGIHELLMEVFNFYTTNKLKNSLMGLINNIKVDLITHQYTWLKPYILYEGSRIASLEDIAAMKLNAIVGSGKRLKDFVDMAYLSSYFTTQQMLNFFEQKYPHNNSMMAFKSLGGFDDINFDVAVNYIKPVSWELIKNRIMEMLHYPDRKFEKIQ